MHTHWRHQLWRTGARVPPLSLRMYNNLAISIYVISPVGSDRLVVHTFIHMLLYTYSVTGVQLFIYTVSIRKKAPPPPLSKVQ